jgi:hypothetical protein
MAARAELHISTTKDEGPRKSTERVDELGDHATKTSVRLRALASSANKASKSLLGLASSSAAAGAAMKGVSKQTDVLHRVVYKGTKELRAMGGMLQKTLTGGLKMATMSIGAMGLALVGIHALFIAGRFLVKSYHVALQGLAGVAAGATVAMGLLSAAMREQQAATYAYTGKNNKEFGSGLNQVRVNMRGLMTDTQLAGAGAEALNKVYAEIAKGKSGYMAGSKTLLKDLGDFASAGQPLEEGLLKAAKVVNAIQDPKTGIGGIQAAFKEMGPAAVEALKKAKAAGIDTKKEFMEAMKNGELSALGGVTGQMDAVNGTLMGKFKTYFALIKGQFADFGQQFLPQAKVALEKIYNIIRVTLAQTSGAIAGFEKTGGFTDMLVKGVQKASDFYVRLIRDYLPKSQGMFDRLGDWWDKFTEGWRQLKRELEPFIEGGKVFEKMFGNAWRPIWAEIRDSSREFNDLTIKNRANWEKIGGTIGETVAELLGVLRIFQRVINENLPFINNMIRGLKVIIEQFTRVFKFMEGLPGMGSQGAMALMLAMARGMKTARGTVVNDKVLAKQMNVQAGSVSISGTVKGAYQGFKLGSNPAVASATGGYGPLAGAAIGGASKGGWLGAKAQAAWEKSYPALRAASALTGGPDKVGGAAGALGLSSKTAAAATAATAAPASTSMSGLASSTTRATSAVAAFATSLTAATSGLRTGTGTPTPGGLILPPGVMPGTPATPSTPFYPTPTGAPIPFYPTPTGAPVPAPPPPGGKFGKLLSKGANARGNKFGMAKQFSAVSRFNGRMMAYSNQKQADKEARGGGKYKMDGMVGGFLLQRGLSKLADKTGDEDVKGGLGLASSMALFSPKLALGVAGGTMAYKSQNMALAAGGGAMAGAAIGKSFGPMGQAIGVAIGTMTGVIMAPINALRAKRKEAKAMVDAFFKDSIGNFMVKMSMVEGEARAKGQTETTIIRTMEDEQAKYKKLADIGRVGAERGGKKTGRLSLAEEIFRGAAVGGTTGAAVGLGAGIVFAAPTVGISLPVATAIGAAIGVTIGATIGLAKWGLNKVTDLFGASSEQKQDRKLKMQSLKDIYAAGGMSDSQFKNLTAKRKRRFARDEDMDDDKVNAYLEEFAEKTAALEEAMGIATETTDERVKVIEQITGKTSMQIISDAQRLGVNLADPFADFNEQLETLGSTVVKSSEQIKQAISTIMSNAIEGAFETAIKQQEAPLILDEAIKNFRQDYDQNPGEISAEQAKSILGTYSEQLTNAYGGDSVAAYFETQRQIGTKDAPGLAFNEFNANGQRNPLGTLGDEFFGGIGGQAATTALGDMESGVADIAMQNLGAILAQQGKSLGAGGLATAKSNFMNMSTEEQQAFFNKVNIGEEGAARLGSPQAFLDSLGITGALTNIDKTTAAFVMAETNAEKEEVLLMAQREITEGMAKFFGPNSENPEWWTKAALRDLFVQAGIIEEDGDTRTPRGRGIGDTTSSRLSQTLARHNAINSAISGKRTITSAFRTNNLGSLNSDHVTGRAFDLTGNQLGMYKTTVERQGGFAEYHGASADRHLHVVPGPGGPMGDTVSPYSSAPQPSMPITASPSGGGAITLNLNVNGIGIKEAVPLIKAELERSLYEYTNRQ